jgi:hypothetical protein
VGAFRKTPLRVGGGEGRGAHLSARADGSAGRSAEGGTTCGRRCPCSFLQGYRLRFGFFYPIQYQSSQYQHANDETKLKHVVACAAVGSLDSCTPAVPLLEATTATASLRELHRTTARTGMHGSACLTCHASSDASLNSKSVGHKVRGTQNQTR